MKKIFLFVVCTTWSISGFAQSASFLFDYEQRHVDFMKESIAKECTFDKAPEFYHFEPAIAKLGNGGVIETHFKTYFTGFRKNVRIDPPVGSWLPGYVDYEYLVTVKSVRMNLFDDAAKIWGVYNIESIVCEIYK